MTKEDYEARVLNISAKYGNVAKVYVTRNTAGDVGYNNQAGFEEAVVSLQNTINGITETGQPDGIISLRQALTELQQGMLVDDRNTPEFTAILLNTAQVVGATNQSLID